MVKVVVQRARQHFHSSPSNAGISQDNCTTALTPQTFQGSPEQEVIPYFCTSILEQLGILTSSFLPRCQA